MEIGRKASEDVFAFIRHFYDVLFFFISIFKNSELIPISPSMGA